MTFYRKLKGIFFNILLVATLSSCEKESIEPRSPEDYYISSNGGNVRPRIGSDFEIFIPPNALEEGQYIKQKLNDDTPQLVLDSVFSFGALSKSLTFATYNCSALKIPGKIKLTINSKYSSLVKFSQASAFCIANDKSILDYSNWEKIATTPISENTFEFQFTDLNKTYFIGWTSN